MKGTDRYGLFQVGPVIMPAQIDWKIVSKMWDYPKLTIGHAGLAFKRAGQRRSIAGAVSDADTVNVGLLGNLAVRFLGIDTPEKRIGLPKSTKYDVYKNLDSEEWEKFLANPYTTNAKDYLYKKSDIKELKLSDGLRTYLQEGLATEKPAINHYLHAIAATKYLEKLIIEDQQQLVDVYGERRFESEYDFRFFLVFAREILDAYGRLLCICKPDEPDISTEERRPSYNLRLLEAGMAAPYFIWPNIEPWRRQEYILNAVIKPGKAWQSAQDDDTMGDARSFIQNARDNNLGIFGDVKDNGQVLTGPLKLMPHEIRFLASRWPPARYVIDLRKDTEWGDTLLHPENYYKIENMEDRLYVPAEYVPLFVKQGWKVQLEPGDDPPVADCKTFCESDF